MSTILLHHFLLLHIPILKNTTSGANRQVVTSIAPADACHLLLLTILTQIVEFGDLGGTGVPKINTRPQADSQDILGRPVHQVEIIIILKSWCNQYLKWTALNLPLMCIRYRQRRLVPLCDASSWPALALEPFCSRCCWLVPDPSPEEPPG